ncbi:MAG: 4Fe-4S dicluster domain-containing protein [Clostridiales bacterium]|nr:4Fe-4S dicluster domain-containing protein [Clostridiales bacterium]
MILFYFSGTGNSKFVARQFCRAAGAECHSVEEDAAFDALIRAHDTVGFCYPVYGSYVPRPMREFVAAHVDALAGRRFVVLCTQLVFSGDGAHELCAFLPGGEESVVYAEHVDMPNNICNFPLFAVKNGAQNARRLRAAKRKILRAADEVGRGVVRRRGFNPLSILLGKSQSKFWPAVEEKAARDVQIDADCIRCGLCVRLCPMKNLTMGENGVEQAGRCAVCYRCVDACPQRAITVMFHKKPTLQYKGIAKDSSI